MKRMTLFGRLFVMLLAAVLLLGTVPVAALAQEALPQLAGELPEPAPGESDPVETTPPAEPGPADLEEPDPEPTDPNGEEGEGDPADPEKGEGTDLDLEGKEREGDLPGKSTVMPAALSTSPIRSTNTPYLLADITEDVSFRFEAQIPVDNQTYYLTFQIREDGGDAGVEPVSFVLSERSFYVTFPDLCLPQGYYYLMISDEIDGDYIRVDQAMFVVYSSSIYELNYMIIDGQSVEFDENFEAEVRLRNYHDPMNLRVQWGPVIGTKLFLDGEQKSNEFYHVFQDGERVSFYTESANGQFQQEYHITVYNQVSHGGYISEVKLEYPSWKTFYGYDMVQYETAQIDYYPDNRIVVRPGAHLYTVPIQEYGDAMWRIDVKLGDDLAELYVNGTRVYDMEDYDKERLLAGENTLRVVPNSGQGEVIYKLIIENPLTWRSPYVDMHVNGDFVEEFPGQVFVEPYGNYGTAYFDFMVNLNNLKLSFEQLEDFDLERVEYLHVRIGNRWEEYGEGRFGYGDNLYEGEPIFMYHPDSHEGLEIDSEGNFIVIRTDVWSEEIPPGYYSLRLELYYMSEEGYMGDPLIVPLGGVQFGDPDYEPRTALPAILEKTMTPEVPTSEDAFVQFDFTLADTDLDSLDVRMAFYRETFPNYAYSSSPKQTVALTTGAGGKQGSVQIPLTTYQYPGFYRILAYPNGGTWYEHHYGIEELHSFALETEAKFLSFSLGGASGAIGEDTITFQLLDNIGKMQTPVFTVPAGATVQVGDQPQVSGVTPQDFSTPVVYKVTNMGLSREYTVSVDWITSNTAAQVESFSAAGQQATIVHPSDEGGGAITLELPYTPGINLSGLACSFTISQNATSVPQAGNNVVLDLDGKTQTIQVTAQDGVTTATYVVTVTMESGQSEHELFWLKVGNYDTVLDHDTKTAYVLLPYTTNPNSTVGYRNIYFEVSEGATTNLVNGGYYNLDSVIYLAITAQDGSEVRYAIIAELAKEPTATISGKLYQYKDLEKVPFANLTFSLSQRYGNYPVVATVNTDEYGEFTYTDRISVIESLYIPTAIDGAELLSEGITGFVSASYYKLDPEGENELCYAKLDPTALQIRGTVESIWGEPIGDATVNYLSVLDTTKADGAFSFHIQKNWISGHSTTFTVRKMGYYDVQFYINPYSAESFRSMVLEGYIEVPTVQMTPVQVGIPLESYSLKALQRYAQPGVPVEVYLHYTAGQRLEDTVLTVTVTDGVQIMGASNPSATIGADNTLTLTETLRSKVENSLRLWVYAPADYTGEDFTISASLAWDGTTYNLGETAVMIVRLSMEMPNEVGLTDRTSDPFTIRGEAVADSSHTLSVEITDLDGNPVQANRDLTGLSTTGIGPWYTISDIRLQDVEPGIYVVTVKLKDSFGQTVEEETRYITVRPDALKLRAIRLWCRSFNVTAKEPISNSSYVTACIYVDYDLAGTETLYINTVWENDETVTDVRYEMVTGHGTYEGETHVEGGGLYQGVFEQRQYAGSGTARVYIEFTQEDGTQSRFLVAVLTLLVDPSGYVYDSQTGDRIEGATVTLEVLENDKWSVWPAEQYLQHNPQTSDVNGEYGWMVPEGEYRVLVSKTGYRDYNTQLDPQYGIIEVLPPREDIFIPLERIESSSGGSGGGTYSRDAGATATTTQAQPTALELAEAKSLVESALDAKGAEDRYATLRVQNVDLLSLSVMKEMLRMAGDTPLRVHVDQMDRSGNVDVRLTVFPEGATGDLTLTASTYSAAALHTEALFRLWFVNENLMVMSTGAKGALGTEVEAAFRLNTGLQAAQDLYLYRYDSEKNSYRLLPCRKDANGYLRFTTDTGGDFIVTDRPLERK